MQFVCTFKSHYFVRLFIGTMLLVACGEGNGNPRQYSCLENSMDRGAWQAPVHGVVKSWTRLTDFHFLSKSQTLFFFFEKLKSWPLNSWMHMKIVKTILKKRAKLKDFHFLKFKTCFKAAVISVLWYLCKDRDMDKLNRLESSKPTLCNYGQLILDKGAKVAH